MSESSDKKDMYIGKYHLTSKLGSGGFSSVYLCEDADHKQYALKRILVVKSKYIEQELQALQALNSPYVVKFVDTFVYKNYPIIIMQYCAQGTLDQYLQTFKDSVMVENQALQMFANILQGFRAIHQAGFVHRDLKCSNILIDQNLPKISDFGLAKKVTSQQMVSSSSCTPSYAAPEVLLGKQHNYKVDIWSLGVILYKMIFGCLPFGNDSTQKLLARVTELCSGGFKITKSPKKKTQDISIDLIKLFKEIFTIDIKSRIGFKELYESPCVSKYIINDNAENIAFYSKAEESGALNIGLLDSSEELKNQKIDEVEENEQVEQSELAKEEAMMTSILLQQKFEPQTKENSSEFEGYLACVNQYIFLIDNYIFFESPQAATMLQCSLQSSHILLLKFFLAKLILFYVKGLKEMLTEKDNVFDIKSSWASFVYSKSYKNLQDRVNKDYAIWKCSFENTLAAVQLLNADEFPAIKGYFDDSFQYSQDTPYFTTFPDNLKLPSRAIFMTALKTLYTSVSSNIFEDQTTQKTKVTINTLNAPPALGIARKPRLSIVLVKERNLRSTILLRLALCASWNRVFSIKNEFNLLGTKVKYDELIQMIHDNDSERSLRQTLAIMDTYFPKLKDFNYNFM